MAVADNIKKLRSIFNVTQRELAEVAGVTENAVSKWENGYAEPRMGAVERIAACYGLSKFHIIEDGGMDYVDPITKRAIVPQKLPPNALPVHGYPMSTVPLVRRVHAGGVVDPDDLTARGETVDVPAFLLESDPDCYACEVEGACRNRVYPTGCVIVVSTNKPPSNGSVAVVDIEGVGTVMRRMYRTARTLVLSPDSFNEGHEDIVITADDGRSVSFGGRVVWFQPREEMQ